MFTSLTRIVVLAGKVPIKATAPSMPTRFWMTTEIVSDDVPVLVVGL